MAFFSRINGTVFILLTLAGFFFARAALCEETPPGLLYPVRGIDFVYVFIHPDHPPPHLLKQQTELELVQSEVGYLTPEEAGKKGKSVSVADIETTGRTYLTAGALQSLTKTIVSMLADKGLMGVYVLPDPGQITKTGEDLRPATKSRLTFFIFTSRVGQLSTYSSGSRTLTGAGNNSGLNSFINDLTLHMDAVMPGTMVLSGNLLTDDDGAGNEGSISLSGIYHLGVNCILDTESGSDAAAGPINLTGSLFSATLPALQLTLDASGTTDGNITLGRSDASAGNLIDIINIAALNITQTGPVAATSLRALASGDALLPDPGNDLETIAGNSGGAFTFYDLDGFVIGSVLGTNGITASGAIDLAAEGNDNLLDIQQALTAGNDSTLIADKMNIAAPVSTGAASLHIRPEETADTNDIVDIGSAADNAANTLELSDTELDRITAGHVTIGTAATGDISFTAPISPDSFSLLALISGGDITQAAAASLTIDDFVLTAQDSIDLSEANDLARIAATATGNITIADINDLTLSTTAGISGITSAGEVSLSTGGNVSQDSGALIEADGLLLDVTGTAGLTEENNVERFAAIKGSLIEFNDVDELIIGTVGGHTGVTVGVQDLLLISASTLTLQEAVTASGNVTFSTGTDFQNLLGSGAISAGGWYRLYSIDPDLDETSDLEHDYIEYDKIYPDLPEPTNQSLSGFIYSTKAPPTPSITNAVTGIENALPEQRPYLQDEGGVMPGHCSPGAQWIDPELCNSP